MGAVEKTKNQPVDDEKEVFKDDGAAHDSLGGEATGEPLDAKPKAENETDKGQDTVDAPGDTRDATGGKGMTEEVAEAQTGEGKGVLPAADKHNGTLSKAVRQEPEAENDEYVPADQSEMKDEQETEQDEANVEIPPKSENSQWVTTEEGKPAEAVNGGGADVSLDGGGASAVVNEDVDVNGGAEADGRADKVPPHPPAPDAPHAGATGIITPDQEKDHKDRDARDEDGRPQHPDESSDPSKNPYAQPGSPSHGPPPHMGYGGQGYMHMYGHPMYPPPYGYPPPHYSQPPYYGGAYQYPPQPHMMHPPHMMAPPPPPPHGYHHEAGGSPGRRYPSMQQYHPYPPASPVVSPNSAANGSHQAYSHSHPEEHYKTTPPRNGTTPRRDDTHPSGVPHDVDKDPKSVDGGDSVHEAENFDAEEGGDASRIKVYVKPSGQASEEVLARRSRKNAQSRARAAKFRDRIASIEKKAESERTPEEVQLFETHQSRRQRKNNRSRERALEKKSEIDRILAKPEKKRTRIEVQFLDTALGAKKRKNEGDRLRRHRLKELGLSPKGSIGKPGIPARGPLPQKYQHASMQKQMEMQAQHHHAHGGYGMPPPGYPMVPPNPHHHEPPPRDDPHSPGGPMYSL